MPARRWSDALAVPLSRRNGLLTISSLLKVGAQRHCLPREKSKKSSTSRGIECSVQRAICHTMQSGVQQLTKRQYSALEKLCKRTCQPTAVLGYLMHDDFVTNRRGIFEYVLGGCQDTKLLNVRLFDKPTMRKVYQQQTDMAKAEGTSNCPYCAIGHDANRQRIWKLEEMDADHVTAWSKGGSTDIENCQMLCKTHNRAKGNR